MAPESCDECPRDSAGRWQVVRPDGQKFYVELCRTHDVALKAIAGRGTPARRGPFGAATIPSRQKHP